nr:hypothetical protein BaRGS_026276 [Batillaria attramentaria]
MKDLVVTWMLAMMVTWCAGQNLLQNGGQHFFDGPSQYVNIKSGHTYTVSGWVKLLNNGGGSQYVQMEVDFHFSDDSHDYVTAAERPNVKTSNGWVHLTGGFTAPSRSLRDTRIYFQSGPDASVNFVVDEASVTEVSGGSSHSSSGSLDQIIDRERKSDIHIHVTTNLNKADVKIRVVQTKKSFPFGTAVNSWKYNDNAANGKYRDFIHKHFNWVVPENALKWGIIEPQRGQKNYQLALDMIHGVRSHGIKVRGHNLVWSVPNTVQDWVKSECGNAQQLRNEVKHHIEETMAKTRGLLEHWDVNNENLHGTWYQDCLHDPDYNLELFRIAHNADPYPKLFLNDYNVVANGASTGAYLTQAQHFKAANVHLYGLGVQSHFGNEQEPNQGSIKSHLDTLAAAGLPIWVTELDVQAADENRRADFYEKALKALYGHPAVEGILFWGFWDQAHWRGEHAALAKGNDLQLTAAGRRVFDLLENQWMTDETHVLSQSGNQFTVRGFHGNYEVHVIYQGHEKTNLKQTFTLGKGAHTVNINVH